MSNERIAIATGSRHLHTQKWHRLVEDALRFHKVTMVVHGGARGIDAIADKVARNMKLKVRTFPADWHKHGLAAGPIRNGEMLKEVVHQRGLGASVIVLAFHDDPENSKGTKDMIRKATKQGLNVEVFTGRPL